MSIHHELDDPTSVTSQFLDTYLPQRYETIESWPAVAHQSPFRAETHEMAHGVASRIGDAFEIRIGLDIAPQPVYVDRLSMLSPDNYRRLMEGVGYANYEPGYRTAGTTLDPVLQSWERDHKPMYLDREQASSLLACYAVAAAKSMYDLDGLTVQEKRDLFHFMYPPDDQSPSDYDKEVNSAYEVLSRMWFSYLVQGRDQLLELGDTGVIAPALVPGYRLADLVIGDTIVDIKTNRSPDYKKAFDQVLCYALLDQYDVLQLKRLGLYVGRFGVVLTVKIDDVLRTRNDAADGKWDELRQLYRAAVHDELQKAAKRYAKHAHQRSSTRTFEDMIRLKNSIGGAGRT